MLQSRTVWGALIASATVLTLVGCAPEEPQASSEPPASSQEQPADNEAVSDGGDKGGATTMPSGAFPASAEFPLPVPEGWAELSPALEEKVGATMTWSATFEFPGDAKAAAASYQALLQTAGFEVGPYAPGEITNDASLYANGKLDGTDYKGMINFDTTHEGVQRASLNFSPA